MNIYFFDLTKRYIGNRDLAPGEDIPENATYSPVKLIDGQEAYLGESGWVINSIKEQVVPESENEL